MTPVPPSDSSNYPRSEHEQGPRGPFQGDKIYVGIDALLTLVGFGMMFAMAPMVAEESMKQQANSPQKMDPAMMQNIIYGMFGCMAVVCIPVGIFLWIFMLKGKTWAFIVSLVLAILGVLNAVYGAVSGPMVAFSIFGILTGIVRSVYLGMRVGGMLGPKPN